MTRNCLILIAATIVLFAGAACRPAGTNYGLSTIIGTLTHTVTAGRESTAATVTVTGSKLIPVVAISRDTLALMSYDVSGEYLWNSTWRGAHLGILPDSYCVLHVYQSDGEAHSGRQVLPAQPTIISPDSGATLTQNSDFNASWDSVGNIDRYEVNVHLSYTYNDFQHFLLDTTITLPETSFTLTIPAGRIFPPDVDSVNSGAGSITVTAETGPNLGKELNGNISGNGIGYFWTRSSDYRSFNIRPPGPTTGTK